ncbi:RagB/SusD family nutrient uptake outer membrane protein [Mucilaginibacter sp. Bleaf8]|uniref:RagB/SusD family nutrient uptake outer membrane protein n=1 Tax=Mucilaginibacter sp. Bleaf8 TaxID=2834430 RepID=UPI001BCD9CC3|nr:RagB/SusD family nutrient uptake outer membrane protein [Mucilaginibacter sp. Bleaf8]MBS7563199.1 RagB/SusD family nutrient uptake outer membrane protein [Mucilaginibacter sp. Bleaf8]
MRINYIITPLFACLLLGTGCKKFLDEPALGYYSNEDLFSNDATTKTAVNAAYIPLTFTDASANPLWVLGDVATDDVIIGGNAGEQADYTSVDLYNILPGNAAVQALWARYYDGINRCNVVTDGLNASNTRVSDEVKKQSLAEVKFLRAYYYFLLTNFYGNIPLRLKVTTAADAAMPLSPQAQVYAQIEKDLTEAVAGLPDKWQAGNDAGRATKGAALALMAKTALFQKKYADAVKYADQVEALGYQLTADYGDNFNASAKNNSEAIFSVWHVRSAQPLQGNSLNYWFAPRALNGAGVYYPTQNLVDNFEPGDPRLDRTIARAGQPYFDSDFDASWSSTGYLSKKHVQPLSEVPSTTKNDANLNYEAIRFADILLIKAEALNESGQSTAALAPLNKVRQRARTNYDGTAPAGLLADITVTDQAQLRDIIRRERRSELALEFQRYFDVMRYGQAYAEAAIKPGAPNFSFAQNRFFPIPQTERNTNGGL